MITILQLCILFIKSVEFLQYFECIISKIHVTCFKQLQRNRRRQSPSICVHSRLSRHPRISHRWKLTKHHQLWRRTVESQSPSIAVSCQQARRLPKSFVSRTRTRTLKVLICCIRHFEHLTFWQSPCLLARHCYTWRL